MGDTAQINFKVMWREKEFPQIKNIKDEKNNNGKER